MKILEILLVASLVLVGFKIVSKLLKVIMYIVAVAVVCHLVGII